MIIPFLPPFGRVGVGFPFGRPGWAFPYLTSAS